MSVHAANKARGWSITPLSLSTWQLSAQLCSKSRGKESGKVWKESAATAVAPWWLHRASGSGDVPHSSTTTCRSSMFSSGSSQAMNYEHPNSSITSVLLQQLRDPAPATGTVGCKEDVAACHHRSRCHFCSEHLSKHQDLLQYESDVSLQPRSDSEIRWLKSCQGHFETQMPELLVVLPGMMSCKYL